MYVIRCCRRGATDLRAVQTGPEDEFRDEVVLGDGLRIAQYAGGNLRSQLHGRLQRNVPLQRHPLQGKIYASIAFTATYTSD